METKLIEVRDRCTFIAMLAIKPAARTEEEQFLLARAGYGWSPEDQADYVLLARLDGGDLNHDPYAWNSRTYGAVHHWLLAHWQQVQSGDVVDVEYIIGETVAPKTSERFLDALAQAGEGKVQ